MHLPVFAGTSVKDSGMTILLYSIDEACALAKVGRSSVYNSINSGDLRAVKRGRRTFILSDDLILWVKNLPEYLVGSPAPIRKSAGGDHAG